MTIPIAHDFTCAWCWIGLHQVKRLKQEFGVTFDWLGYELYPEEIPWPEPTPKPAVETNRPTTPSRLELAYAAEGMEPPTADRPKRMRIHNALEAVEYTKSESLEAADQLVERLYNAYWTKGIEINDLGVLENIAKGVVHSIPGMLQAIREKRFRDNIVPFDEAAYKSGVYNVPTFFINGQRLAEQPYVAIRKAFGK